MNTIELLNIAIEVKEDFVPAWNSVGRIAEKIKEYDLAFEAYEKTLEFDDRYYYAWQGMGSVLIKQGKYSEAVEAYNKVITIVSESSEDVRISYPLHGVWNSKGKALLAINEYTQVIEAFNQTLEIKPDFASASFNLGQTWAKLHLYENAILAFDGAIQNAPDWQAPKTEKAKTQKLLDNTPSVGIVMKNTNNNEGVRVVDVVANSPAQKVGIKIDDIITHIDNSPISNIYEVQNIIRSGQIDSWMEFEIQRNGSTKYIDIQRRKLS